MTDNLSLTPIDLRGEKEEEGGAGGMNPLNCEASEREESEGGREGGRMDEI